MAFERTDKIWMNGKFVKWDDAKIHILSHVIHYGTALFEGARCYKTKKGSAIFRLQPHTDRLFNSCKMYRIEVPYTKEEINKAIIETIKINKQEECYLLIDLDRWELIPLLVPSMWPSPFGLGAPTLAKRRLSREWMSWFRAGEELHQIPCPPSLKRPPII